DTAPLEKKSHCLSQGLSGLLSLGKLFRDSSWTLSKEELSRGVSQFGLDFSDADVNKLFSDFEKKAAVEAAFKHLDKTGDGVVTVEDIKGVYSAKVVKGEATEEEILKKFLNMFESSTSVDGKVTKKEFLDYYSGLSK
uniref:Crustacean calcium-binding protein 23 (Fragments) n=1 Tax=Homarus americanus TaxID=6706 RepID=CCB23_HOMAM|nr:RecName: Full=Crustacean calcium-binding protein 23; Short=CCBP-23 [Homarus americanus]